MQENHSKMAHFGIHQAYALHGDFAELSAELALPTLNETWALQLWACDAPAATGELDGVMVAEASVDVGAVDAQGKGFVSTQVPATLPVSGRDYAMVMALARRDANGLAHIHAISNFQQRQWVEGPRLNGGVGYSIEGETVRLSVDSVHNPRVGNVSGTLALELWAVSKPFDGREQKDAQKLAGLELTCLAGQSSHTGIVGSVPFRAPARGCFHVVLVLREWTAMGYVTRDYRTFDLMYQHGSEPAPVVVSKGIGAARVCIHTATVDDLAAVPGLTKRLAQEIVRNRPFKSLDELLRVRGIGDKTLRKLRALLKA
jgi:DNA uptake protein ComE-like DNA-binding protein